MDQIKQLLDEEIKTEIENLSSLPDGSQEKTLAIDDLTKIYKLRIEEIKAETDRTDKKQSNDLERDKFTYSTLVQDDENAYRERCRRDQNLDRWLNFGLQIGLTVIGFIAYDVWNRRGFRFEENGTITSPQNRNLLSKMIPRIKN